MGDSGKRKRPKKSKNKSKKKIDDGVGTSGDIAATSSPVTPIRTVRKLSFPDSPCPALPVDNGSEDDWPSIDRSKEAAEEQYPRVEFTRAVIDLDMIPSRHALFIQQRNQRRVLRTLRSSRNATTRAVASSGPERPVALLTLEQAWRLKQRDLLRDHSDVFSSYEATLEEQTAVGQGRAAYNGVPVSDLNNSDLKNIYRLEYEPKISGGGSDGSFKQLCIVAGQPLRLCIVCDVLEMETLGKPGQLFHAICHKETFDLLLSHFRVRAVCTTVMTKAFQLIKTVSMPRFISKAKVSCTPPMPNTVAYICVLRLTSKKLLRDSALQIVGVSMTVYRGLLFLCRTTFRVSNKTFATHWTIFRRLLIAKS